MLVQGSFGLWNPLVGPGTGLVPMLGFGGGAGAGGIGGPTAAWSR